MKITILGFMFLQCGIVFGMENSVHEHVVRWKQPEDELDGLLVKAIKEDDVALFNVICSGNPMLMKSIHGFSKIAHCNSYGIINFLLTSPNFKEQCLLHAAILIKDGSPELVKLLVENGLDVNGKSVITRCAATYDGQPGIMPIAGGACEVKDKRHNVLWAAEATQDVEREKAKLSVLVNAGANLNVVDAYGQNIWDLWALSRFNGCFGKDKARVMFLRENGVAIPERDKLRVKQILNQ